MREDGKPYLVRYTDPEGNEGIHGRFRLETDAQEGVKVAQRWFKNKAKVWIEGPKERVKETVK